METVTEQRMWGIEEVITFFSGRVSKSWVERHTRSGELPSHKICGKRFYDPTEVVAWAKSQSKKER